jgi:hypothetical protein
VVQAAALQRVVDFARPVRGEDHPWRALGPDRADLRDGHLEVREDLEEIGLELLVCSIDLVDEEDRRDAGWIGLEGLEQRAADEELRPEDLAGIGARGLAARLEQPDLEHLARVVPFVDRGVDVEALIALEPDERRAEARREDLREFRLADAGLALEQERAAELEREERRRRERAIAHVIAFAERVLDALDRPEHGIGDGGCGRVRHRWNLHCRRGHPVGASRSRA